MKSLWKLFQVCLLVVLVTGLVSLSSTVLAYDDGACADCDYDSTDDADVDDFDDDDISSTPTVDDVLDDPQDYVGQVVTLEGEVDHACNATTFLMEDDQDLIGEDQILVVSVWPEARVDGELDEGNLVSATGTVRIFNRAELENEYGTSLDLSNTPAEEFEGEPVLVMGATEFAAAQQPKETELAIVIPPPAPQIEPAPAEPEITEPLEPAPQVQEPIQEPPKALPRTATPLPLVGLAGLLSLLTGLGIRKLR